MARIIHCHPSQTLYEYHIFTDLDFWDARKILRRLARVKRNFGPHPPGDEFPTQVVGSALGRSHIARIERRLKRAIASPPRHVIVREVLSQGHFEFDPLRFYPARWSRSRMVHFTLKRLPLHEGPLNTPYRTVRVSWNHGKIRVERIPRKEKYDPVIRTREEQMRRKRVPSCF